MNDRTVQLVIVFLGLIALVTVTGSILLAYQSKEIPAALVAIGSGAAGAIGGILARTNNPAPPSLLPEARAQGSPPN